MDTLPAHAIELLVEMAEDDTHRRYRRLALDAAAHPATDQLEDALVSDGLSVRTDVCGGEPNEVCVVAYGRDRLGRVWPSTPILLFDPEWSHDAQLAEALAQDVVTQWDRVRRAAVAA